MASLAPVGRHLIADLSGLAPEALRDSVRIMGVLEEALDRCGFHRLDTVVHRFVAGGAGFTGVVLLTESHAAVHTYPEHGYLALDIFGCGGGDPAPVLKRLVDELKPEDVQTREVVRAPGVAARP